MKRIIYYFLAGIFFALPANAKTIADHLLDTYNAKQAILTAINAKGGGLTISTAFRNYIPGIERMCAGTATTDDAPKIGDGTIDKELEELASTKERIAAALTAKGITLSENAGLLNYGPAIAAKSCCSAGTYSTGGMNPCVNCGIGHFCTGGAQRTACTYGTQACVGTNHTYDVQFICPILNNIGTSGHECYPGARCPSVEQNCYTGANDGNWTAKGPWGVSGATITISGFSRCSTTSASRYDIGYPAEYDGTGANCWCRLKDGNSNVGAWVFLNPPMEERVCEALCAADCAGNFFYGDSVYRKAVCVAPLQI
jgi:hypothetical protein